MAGGLLVPIIDRYTMADLARDMALPILLVVDSKLGAINHALLTLECARGRDLSTAAYVLNRASDTDDAATTTNGDLLARKALFIVVCLGLRRFVRENRLQTNRRNGNEIEQLKHRGKCAVLSFGHVRGEQMHRVRSGASNSGGDHEPEWVAFAVR